MYIHINTSTVLIPTTLGQQQHVFKIDNTHTAAVFAMQTYGTKWWKSHK